MMADSAQLESNGGQSETMALYHYEPLPTREHTRVLVLEPGPNNDSEMPLVASLRLLNLDEPHADPFEALSYVWGPSTKPYIIVVDGRLLRITASLREALLQTRLTDRPRTVWADGICINQLDNTEKGHQVAAMGKIYKMSKRTLICLGMQDPEHAQYAAGLVNELNRMIEDILRGTDVSGKAGSFPLPAENDAFLDDSRWELGWNLMLDQPWFFRGWVVQEASLGPDAYVLWASVQIRWASILRVNYWLECRGSSAPQSQGRHCLLVHHYCSFARCHPEEARIFDENSQDIYWASSLTTLFETRWLDLSDPRDRIYAFMALDTSDGILADLQLDPDYSRSFLEIYHEFAVKYIEKTGDLDVLSFIQHSEESLAGSTMAEAIPSWVPRWDLGRHLRYPVAAHMGNYLKTFKFTEEDSVLRVRGLILGSVVYAAAQEPYIRRHLKSLALQNVISLWSEVIAASRMSEGPYNGRQAFAFFDALCPYPQLGTSEEWSTWRQDFAQHLQSFLLRPERDSAGLTTSQSNGLRTKQHPFRILVEAIRRLGRRRFVILSRGYYGIVPPITQAGDLFALFYGTESLSILRPAKDKPGHYHIVGPAYVESKTVLRPNQSHMMGTEGCRDWEEWDLTEEDINLC